MAKYGIVTQLIKKVIPLTASVNFSSKLRTRHKVAVALLKRLGLAYVRLEPAGGESQYSYIVWNAPRTRNGCPPILKRGKVDGGAMLPT